MTVVDANGTSIAVLRSSRSRDNYQGMVMRFKSLGEKFGYFVFVLNDIEESPAKMASLFYINYLNLTLASFLWHSADGTRTLPTIVDKQKLLVLVNLPSEELKKISKINFTFSTD
jgi:hypothetical protein